MGKWQRLNFQPNIPLGEGGKKVTACKEHIELSKKAAEEGMVLLKNEGEALPLKKGTKTALFGKASFDYVKGGGGSGDVTVSYTRNLYEGLKMQGNAVDVFEPLSDFYRENVKKQYADGRVPGFTIEPEIPAELLKSARAYTDTAIITICRYSGEGWDRRSSYDHGTIDKSMTDPVMLKRSKEVFSKGDFYLSAEENKMIEEVTKLFAHVSVVLNIGGVVDTTWFADNRKIEAVLAAWQCGIEGGLAATEILTGKVNPSGRLTDTYAKRLEDYPSSRTFHESTAYVNYTEDIYVGYRYFETIPGESKKVVYPFGYGLSYTTFAIKDIMANEKSGSINVAADVCNTGRYPGKEVVEVYYSAPQGKLGKPAKELAAFAKTRELAPGEIQHMDLSFAITEMASFDDLGKIAKSAYVLEAGEYKIFVGKSVEDVQETAYSYKIKKDKVVNATEFSKVFEWSVMTSSRALNELYDAKLLTYKIGGKTGRSKYYSRISDPDYFEKGKFFLDSPVKKVVYTMNEPKDSFVAGLEALSKLSMINPPGHRVRAIYSAEVKKHNLEIVNNKDIIRDKELVELQIWGYDPKIFTDKKIVDVASLYASLKEENDERIEQALEEVLREKKWYMD